MHQMDVVDMKFKVAEKTKYTKLCLGVVLE